MTRADVLYDELLRAGYRRTDRIFAILLAVEWAATVATAVIISPTAWSGEVSVIHLNLWMALFLGGLLAIPPAALAVFRPGRGMTRHALAVGQMLMGSLLIHLSGGRIEVHFHVFGSLAFLSLYRDWRVMATATLVVTADHFLRGVFWPLSIFGVLTASPWRWVEHAAWVVFEDSVLVYGGLQSRRELREVARGQAEGEAVRGLIEREVRERTDDLLQEVAEREVVMESLRQSHERFAGIFDASVVGLALVHPDGRWLQVNPALCQIVGYSRDELLSLDYQTLTHPDDLEADVGLARRLKAGEIPHYQMEKRYFHKQGHVIWVALSVSLVRDASGEPLHFVSLIEDISPRKKAEESLNERELRLRAIFDHTFQFMGLLTPEGNLIEANRSSLTFVNATREDVIGRPFWECPWWDNPPGMKERVRAAVAHAAAGHVVRFDTEHTGADGRTVAVDFSIKPVTDDAGRVVMLLPEGHDVTERKEAQAATARAKDAAEAATRAKSEFLANMSHEIRTPMNGIMGMTDLALETELSARQREYLSLVKSSADSLLTVINDILDFSKIEAGKLELSPAPFRFRDVVEETVRTLALRSHAKGLELACRIAPDVPDDLFGDSDRLRQVVVNLIGNAIKFTERGEIVFQAELAAPGVGGEVDVNFSVTDTGIGIASGKLASIFEPFEQADNSTTRRYGGTGLGLAISGKLVTLMGGRIWVESRAGSGSTFHFTSRFLRHEPGPEAGGPKVRASLEGARVLVVDDNATNRRILVEVLTNWGARPTAVEGGPEALGEFRKAAAAGEPFDAAVLDMMMPDMDGLELARRVRAEPRFSRVALILMSSDGNAGQNSCGGGGFDACLSKPLRQSELYDAMAVLLGGQLPAPAADPGPDPAATIEKAGTGLRVLLAEDHPVNQKLASRILEGAGHKVTIVDDGLKALQALAEAEFDVVLMDVQMPVMDGFEAVASIRASADPAVRRVPVIALTAHAMKGDRERCLDAGFDAYLAKPVRAEALRNAIAALAAAPTAEAEAEAVDGGGLLPFFDGLVEQCGGDAEFARELLGSFLEAAPASADAIRSALESGEPGLLISEAHGLKGACLTIGADDLAGDCKRLEQASRDQGAGAAAGDAARAVLRGLSGLSAALETYLSVTI